MTRAHASDQPLALDAAELRAAQRRVLKTVVATQVLGGAGLAAGVTVGALLATDMLGGDSVAGLPASVLTLGSALSAYVVGRASQRWGRRPGLAGGFAVASLGAVGVVAAATLDDAWLLFLSFFLYGSGTATNLQARYAGTDLAEKSQRATAAAAALVATTLGAVAGPNLVHPLGDLADALGIPRLAGPFLLAALAYAAAAVCLHLFLRPDPLHLARRVAAERHNATTSASRRGPDLRLAGVSRGVVLAATVMVLTQTTMVAIMTMTPIHMRHHHHGLGAVGLVISLHIAAMFLPSLLTGRLIDRVGRIPMVWAAGATLLAAGVVAAVAPPSSTAWLILALVLLGLGWNIGLLSGTALLVDSTPTGTRARTQGSVDVLVALAGAGGAAASGVVVDATSYPVLALGGGLLALALVPIAAWYAAHPSDPENP